MLLLQGVDAPGLYPRDEVLHPTLIECTLFNVGGVQVLPFLADFVHPFQRDVQVAGYLPGAHAVELVPIERDLKVPENFAFISRNLYYNIASRSMISRNIAQITYFQYVIKNFLRSE